MRERFACWALFTFAAGVLLVFGAAAGAAEEPGASYTVTLITGDRVHIRVFPDGRQAATGDPASRGADLPEPTFETVEVSGDLYVFPSDTVGYLDEKLDRELFNVTELVAEGFHDKATDSLPVIVDYNGAVRDLPTPLNDVDTLESIDAVAAREPKAEAAGFGRALAEQAHRDAAAGKPGAHAASRPDLFAGIDKIWLDAKFEVALTESVPQIGAPAAWEAGHDGTGVTVAVLDTGIDVRHPDLVRKVAAARNFTTSPVRTDRHGHGTHVASTVAGSGAASGGTRKGVAPGALLLNGKVLGDDGEGAASWIIAGMEWAAADKDADIVNMSLGSQSSSDGSDPVSQAVNALTGETGALFVVAAGNRGPYDQTIDAPGVATSALTVGAVDKSNILASFSSRGPRLGDFAIKPDITGPGVNIGAARATRTSLGNPIDEHYTQLDGTSMATPHVAGAAALLAQRHPDWDADELKPTLITTASFGSYTIYQQGGGRVDLARAFTQPEVLATPAPFDLGFFDWPHKRARVSKSVTYTNLSGSRLALELSLELADEGGNPPPPGMIKLGAKSVTLAPGASKEVQVTVNTRLGAVGLYGGSLLAEHQSAAARLRTPVGFYKEPERLDIGWTSQLVDRATDADSYGGTRTFIRTAPSGTSTILYADGPLAGGQFDLKLARGPLPDGTFSLESIDPGDSELAGYGSLHVDAEGQPHVSYVSGLFFGQGILKYARRQADGWQIEVADANQGVWDDTALAMDSENRPMIAYSHGGFTLRGELRLATRESTGWVSELVSRERIEALDLVLDSTGLPRIAYVAWDGSAYVLRLARYDGASWVFETISHVSSQGYEFGVDLLLDSGDRARIAFAVYEPVQGLSFARQARSGWEVELLRAGQLWQPAAALDPTDTVRLVFYDATHGALVYAQEGGRGSWLFQTVEDDPSGDIRIGRQPSIAVDAFGRTHLSYYLGDMFQGAALKYAVSTQARSGTSPAPATHGGDRRWLGAPVVEAAKR